MSTSKSRVKADYNKFISTCKDKKKCKSAVVKVATKKCTEKVHVMFPMLPVKKVKTLCNKKVTQFTNQKGGSKTKTKCCKCTGGKYWGSSNNCAIGIETGKIPCCRK